MKSFKLFIALASLFGLAAVIIGALSAHTLQQNLSPEALQRANTGLNYHFYHTLALLSVGILSSLHRNKDSILLKISGTFFTLGIILFSGNLYVYAITNDAFFSKLTPFGGGFLMLGWLFLFFFSFKK